MNTKKTQLILIDRNLGMQEAWKEYFAGEPSVKIIKGDIKDVSCDTIVSPANSFGFMDGGIDYAISEKLGWSLQEELQKQIRALPMRELLIGQTLVLETGSEEIPYLISAPTMRVPMSFNIASSVNAYLAMKAIMLAVTSHPQMKKVAIPGLCTGVGRMPYKISAIQMYRAYQEIFLGKKPHFTEFGQTQKYQIDLNPEGMIYDW